MNDQTNLSKPFLQLATIMLQMQAAMIETVEQLGYPCEPGFLQDEDEWCRAEGDDVIVVVYRRLEDCPEGRALCYDIEVCCRDMDQRPRISYALQPVVDRFAAQDQQIFKELLSTLKTNNN